MKAIDERPHAHTKRHEALTMSVQLLLAESQEDTRRLQVDGEHMRALAGHVKALVGVAETA